MEGGRKTRLTRMGRPPCSVDRREGGGASEAEGRALEALRWLGAWVADVALALGHTPRICRLRLLVFPLASAFSAWPLAASFPQQ